MIKLNIVRLLVIMLTLSLFACDKDKDISKSALKIVLFDSLSVEYEDEALRLPENYRELCSILESDTKSCNRAYVFEPLLVRLDLGKELSLKTAIEKGGSKRITSPKVVGKLIQKNFDDLNIPKYFTRKSTIDTVSKLIPNFLANKAANDSILVLNEVESVDKYTLNAKSYNVFANTNDLRTKMLAILCENSKASFTILVNPPKSDVVKNVVVVGPTSTTLLRPNLRPSIPVASPGKKRNISQKVSSGTGDLSMVKGSEGCDVCTRYYSATDNVGRIRQIKESNSTNCCPCGKTIEMRGRTYIMNCNGSSSNRLELVD